METILAQIFKENNIWTEDQKKRNHCRLCYEEEETENFIVCEFEALAGTIHKKIMENTIKIGRFIL